METLELYNTFSKILEKHPAPIFLKTDHEVQGYKVETFIYKLADYSIMSQNSLSREMRGATFVFNTDGTIYRFYPSVHKFYNINENESTLLSNIDEDSILEIMVKEDGVLATFVELPNGNIVPKTKGSFDNEQCGMISQLYGGNVRLRYLVKECLDMNIQPFFEFVSPKNKIVLDYDKAELRLIILRDIQTLNYIGAREFLSQYGIDYSPVVKLLETGESLAEIIERTKTEEGYEGYVFRLPDDLFKRKTDWYFKIHRLTFDELAKENDIIKLHFEQKLDDAKATLSEDMVEKRAFIDNVVDTVMKVFSNIKDEVVPLVDSFDGDIKSFALENSKHKMFSIAIQVVRGGDINEHITNYILKNCRRYKETKEFLEKWK